ncbi:MAG: DUF6496 domain-containing protein [Terriglobales bacterium]
MPEKQTIRRAQEDKREGKAPSTQAGEFVREEMDHIREGKHGAKNTKQAIAIGLSKARRSGVKLRAPKKGKASSRTRKQAKRDLSKGRSAGKKTSSRRSRAVRGALKKMGRSAASRQNLSRQARSASRKRSSSSRSAAAKKAVQTKGPTLLKRAAKKAARTRERKAA